MSKKFDYVFYNKYMKLLCVKNVSFKKPLNVVKTGLTALLVCTPASVGDSFCKVTTKTFEPKVVFVDDENQISRCTNYERHGRLEDM